MAVLILRRAGVAHAELFGTRGTWLHEPPTKAMSAALRARRMPAGSDGCAGAHIGDGMLAATCAAGHFAMREAVLRHALEGRFAIKVSVDLVLASSSVVTASTMDGAQSEHDLGCRLARNGFSSEQAVASLAWPDRRALRHSLPSHIRSLVASLLRGQWGMLE